MLDKIGAQLFGDTNRDVQATLSSLKEELAKNAHQTRAEFEGIAGGAGFETPQEQEERQKTLQRALRHIEKSI